MPIRFSVYPENLEIIYTKIFKEKLWKQDFGIWTNNFALDYLGTNGDPDPLGNFLYSPRLILLDQFLKKYGDSIDADTFFRATERGSFEHYHIYLIGLDINPVSPYIYFKKSIYLYGVDPPKRLKYVVYPGRALVVGGLRFWDKAKLGHEEIIASMLKRGFFEMLPVPDPTRAKNGCLSTDCLLSEVQDIDVRLYKRDLCSKCYEDLKRIIENIKSTP
jgi:hypothetical protein